MSNAVVLLNPLATSDMLSFDLQLLANLSKKGTTVCAPEDASRIHGATGRMVTPQSLSSYFYKSVLFFGQLGWCFYVA